MQTHTHTQYHNYSCMRWYGVSLIIFLPAANVWCDASTTGRAWGRDPVHWAHSNCTWSRALDNWSMHLIQLERRKRKGGREREKGEGRERKGERWKIENTLFNQYCLIYSLSTLSLSFSFPPTLYFPPPLSLLFTLSSSYPLDSYPPQEEHAGMMINM